MSITNAELLMQIQNESENMAKLFKQQSDLNEKINKEQQAMLLKEFNSSSEIQKKEIQCLKSENEALKKAQDEFREIAEKLKEQNEKLLQKKYELDTQKKQRLRFGGVKKELDPIHIQAANIFRNSFKKSPRNINKELFDNKENYDILYKSLYMYNQEKLPHMDHADLQHHTKAMIESTAQNGGFLVLPAYSTSIIQRVYEMSPVKQYSNIVEISTNDYKTTTYDGLGSSPGYWSSELQTIDETPTGKFYEADIRMNECVVKPYVSNLLLRDAVYNVAEQVSQDASTTFALMEGAAAVNGDGKGKPNGILATKDFDTDISSGEKVYTPGALERVESEDVKAITYDDIINLQTALYTQYSGDAAFYMNKSTFGYIRKLKDLQGQSIFDNRFMQQGAPLTLFGQPVILIDAIPAFNSVTASKMTTDIDCIIYGSMRRGYTFIQNQTPIMLLEDPYTPNKNGIYYRFIMSTGGGVVDCQALKILRVRAS